MAIVCRDCAQLRDEMEVLRAEVEFAREYDRVRQNLTAWVKLDSQTAVVFGRIARTPKGREQARDALKRMNLCYFDEPDSREEVQQVLDAGKRAIAWFKEVYDVADNSDNQESA